MSFAYVDRKINVLQLSLKFKVFLQNSGLLKYSSMTFNIWVFNHYVCLSSEKKKNFMPCREVSEIWLI